MASVLLTIDCERVRLTTRGRQEIDYLFAGIGSRDLLDVRIGPKNLFLRIRFLSSERVSIGFSQKLHYFLESQ